ncbi:MAG: hypothetical protein HC839_01670 [Leptolyngbyaceae cyanobacterium RM2_2_21]|nr:hypothetical protein [Leptolyngbyaceae cyanobacterium RM2_2_21]
MSPLLSQSPVLYDVGFPCHPLRTQLDADAMYQDQSRYVESAMEQQVIMD